jgi:hypothetical protein
MADDTLRVRLTLDPGPDADAEDAERLGRRLRSELREFPVDDVVPVEDGAPPPGAKGVDAASLTELLVTMSAGGGVFVTVLAGLKDWLTRNTGARGVKVTIDGDTLELTSATAAERAGLVDAFVRRHLGS